METEELGACLAVGTWVDVLQHSLIIWNEKAVVTILRVEVNVIAQLLYTPIEDAHRLVDESWECNRNVCHRIEHLLSDIHCAITCHVYRFHIISSNAKFIISIVEHTIELAWH